MRDKPFFGPGGNSGRFYAEGGKSTKDAPAWLEKIGLTAYEYEGGNGITAGEKTLSEIGLEAKKHNISMSLHTPYFISLSSVELEKRIKSIKYIEQSLKAAKLLCADTIVIHSGSCAKISRDEAMKYSTDTLFKTLDSVETDGVFLGIETMGKLNQLGTLDEVIELCKLDGQLSPVVDFGHLNARDCGGVFKTVDDYARVFEKVAEELGDEKSKYMHCHFSKIEWTEKGEKKHLTFEDTVFGPEFEPLCECIAKYKLCPRIICESDGTMADDALKMQTFYNSLK